MAEQVEIVITATDKASIVLNAVTEIMGTLSGAVKQVASEYIDYGDQVKQLSTFTGLSNDETSRLIQLADDAFVSYDTLKTAARSLAMENKRNADGTEAANQQIDWSIQTLAKLSDQYNALGTNTQRQTFLLEHFGRSGMDMARVMELGGKKISEMAASTSQSLIIDDQKMQRIYATKRALDEYNDALAGMKYDTADKLLGIFNGMPKPLRDAVLWINMLTSTGIIDKLVRIATLLLQIKTMGGAAGAAGVAGAAGKAAATGAAGAAGAGLGTILPAIAGGAVIQSLPALGINKLLNARGTSLNQLWTVEAYGLGKLFGGEQMGLSWAGNMGRATGAIPNVTYNNYGVDANNGLLQKILAPFIQQQMRTQGVR